AALARHPIGREACPRRTAIESSTEKKMTKNNAAQSGENACRNESSLDSRYGEIGISAVAAALRYQSEVKNPAYAPVVHQLDRGPVGGRPVRSARRAPPASVPSGMGPVPAGGFAPAAPRRCSLFLQERA